VSTGGAERTYSIWGLLALFAVIGITGLLALILVAFPRSPTTQVAGHATRNTVPGASASGATASSPGVGRVDPDAAPPLTSDPATANPAGPVTVPGGAAAPTGVREVLVSDGATSFTFDVASDFPADGATTAVAPLRVVPGTDGASLNASIGCGTSSQEVLAQLSLSETTSAVTVIAVVLVPVGGAPCDPAAAAREVNVPLSKPLGARSVVVVPAGTPIPQLPPS
jgi:hypothetical protein